MGRIPSLGSEGMELSANYSWITTTLSEHLLLVLSRKRMAPIFFSFRSILALASTGFMKSLISTNWRASMATMKSVETRRLCVNVILDNDWKLCYNRHKKCRRVVFLWVQSMHTNVSEWNGAQDQIRSLHNFWLDSTALIYNYNWFFTFASAFYTTLSLLSLFVGAYICLPKAFIWCLWPIAIYWRRHSPVLIANWVPVRWWASLGKHVHTYSIDRYRGGQRVTDRSEGY